MKRWKNLMFLLLAFMVSADAQTATKVAENIDTYMIGEDTLKLHFFGHASLMLEYRNRCIYIDPVNPYADYRLLPKADIILITHEHRDHLDPEAIAAIRKTETVLLANAKAAEKIPGARVIRNGESREFTEIKVTAVPAYNTSKGRKMFHPQGKGNGYVLKMGGKYIYVAGDTEDIPEMKKLGEIAIAFLPVNQPYTMTVEQAAKAAKIIKPEILYPYHYSDTDLAPLLRMLRNSGIEVRIRNMQ
ncbi:MAG: MBL fold metallo-hydrolase [Candidatus Neomarinimicrobiota bacterium]|nr:MBL fold metallo-hydrolase [Candidatus Neomarinimicrobiota bacterium]